MENNLQQDPNKEVMSMGQWLITILVTTLIPCVNIIMLFVWAFSNGNENRKNYCRAMLIFDAIMIVLCVIFYSTLAAILMSAMSY